MKRTPLDQMDAYSKPRKQAEGCQHMLGCNCDVPYWLRPPSPQELKRWLTPSQPQVGDANV